MIKTICVGIIAFAICVNPVVAVPPTITVTWTGSPPTPGTDYIITTSPPASADFPNVALLVGSTSWRIYSTDTDNPGDIGDIGIVSCPANGNFTVRILDGSNGPGARNVKGIVLDPTDAGNESNIVAGTLTGDLDGNLVVQRSSGDSGGEVTLTIDGNVTSGSSLTIPRVKNLVVGGDVAGAIDVGLLLRWPSSPSGVALDIMGDVTTNGSITVEETQDEGAGGCGSPRGRGDCGARRGQRASPCRRIGRADGGSLGKLWRQVSGPRIRWMRA